MYHEVKRKEQRGRKKKGMKTSKRRSKDLQRQKKRLTRLFDGSIIVAG